MILVSSCICLCPIHWSQVLSREWRCSWSTANRQWSTIWLPIKVQLILGIWLYFMCHACDNFFSCDHTVLRTLLSIRLSVHSSVSVTPFPQCPCHHIMKFSAVITFDKSDVHTKGQGEMSFISRGSLLFIISPVSEGSGDVMVLRQSRPPPAARRPQWC